MSDTPPQDLPEPANLRFLRRLVTTLTATMILGLIAIFVVLVIRLQATAPAFPEMTALPADVQILSVTRTASEVIVISQSKQLFVLSPDGETLRHSVDINQD